VPDGTVRVTSGLLRRQARPTFPRKDAFRRVDFDLTIPAHWHEPLVVVLRGTSTTAYSGRQATPEDYRLSQSPLTSIRGQVPYVVGVGPRRGPGLLQFLSSIWSGRACGTPKGSYTRSASTSRFQVHTHGHATLPFRVHARVAGRSALVCA
jgi:hypothetical protein